MVMMMRAWATGHTAKAISSIRAMAIILMISPSAYQRQTRSQGVSAVVPRMECRKGYVGKGAFELLFVLTIGLSLIVCAAFQ